MQQIRLFTPQIIEEFATTHQYMHIGLIQIAVKPLTRKGLNTSILACLRDQRHNDFEDSLLGIVETSLTNGPIYFDCFPNFS